MYTFATLQTNEVPRASHANTTRQHPYPFGVPEINDPGLDRGRDRCGSLRHHELRGLRVATRRHERGGARRSAASGRVNLERRSLPVMVNHTRKTLYAWLPT